MIAALPVLRDEAESLSPMASKRGKRRADAAHPVWGRLADSEDCRTEGQRAEDQGGRPRTVTRTQGRAKDRLKIVKAQIKALEKLEKERDERIAEVNRRADRETAEVQEAIADLQRICADPDEARRYFVVAEKAEIEENEFNLNLPRYVDTFEPEEEIRLGAALRGLASGSRPNDGRAANWQQLLGIEQC